MGNSSFARVGVCPVCATHNAAPGGGHATPRRGSCRPTRRTSGPWKKRYRRQRRRSRRPGSARRRPRRSDLPGVGGGRARRRAGLVRPLLRLRVAGSTLVSTAVGGGSSSELPSLPFLWSSSPWRLSPSRKPWQPLRRGTSSEPPGRGTYLFGGGYPEDWVGVPTAPHDAVWLWPSCTRGASVGSAQGTKACLATATVMYPARPL